MSGTNTINQNRRATDSVKPAVLVLEDGTRFRGTPIGADGSAVGEVVFNTSMTGYQEILTDPSYARQIVTLTYPHIGNTGCNPGDVESTGVHAAGLIIRDLPTLHSNWRATQSLPDYLASAGIVAIADLDTRRLTRHLRTHGAMAGCVLSASDGEDNDIESLSARALEQARAFEGLAGMDLAKVVSCKESYQWDSGCWQLESDSFEAVEGAGADPATQPHVVAMDFGVKHNILRMLHERGCRITVVPAETPADAVLALSPDGVFLSNGPGDPEPCVYAIDAIRTILKQNIPVFGICLGHQLLALASGANTLKMKFGHHGANHPVQDLESGQVMISSQNHGFAVDPDSLGNTLKTTHVSLFDGSIQGLERNDVEAFSFQGHPEASPGPHDVAPLFDRFVTSMGHR